MVFLFFARELFKIFDMLFLLFYTHTVIEEGIGFHLFPNFKVCFCACLPVSQDFGGFDLLDKRLVVFMKAVLFFSIRKTADLFKQYASSYRPAYLLCEWQ